MASSSLCPHMLQEYFKRVTEIAEVYKSQIVQFVKYEEVSGLLLNRRILKQEEHNALSQLPSNDIQMARTLEILLKRMWGLENLITVLIEVNVDSWLVEEMFQKYVHYVVNEVRRLQALRSCRCFENERRSYLRKVSIRFFQMCDGWLFSIGTSIGCLTQTIYPTHNSLQFINDLLPIPRATQEIVILPRIESIPFDYSYESDHAVQITEVFSDAEKSPTTPVSIEGAKLKNGTLKNAVLSPTKSHEQQNGGALSPSSRKLTSAGQPLRENEIKLRASLAKTPHDHRKVISRDLKLASVKNAEKRETGVKAIVVHGQNQRDSPSEEEPDEFPHQAEAGTLLPLRMKASNHPMSKSRPESTDLTESLPENYFLFSPIPVASNLRHPRDSSETLKSGFHSTIVALPVHDNLLYSPRPYNYTFGEVEKRSGTCSSSSISLTNGSSQELSNILGSNFEYPNPKHFDSFQRSVSIPAFNVQSLNANNPYLMTSSILEESAEKAKPVLPKFSKHEKLQEKSTYKLRLSTASSEEVPVQSAVRKGQQSSPLRSYNRSSILNDTSDKVKAKAPVSPTILEKRRSGNASVTKTNGRVSKSLSKTDNSVYPSATVAKSVPTHKAAVNLDAKAVEGKRFGGQFSEVRSKRRVSDGITAPKKNLDQSVEGVTPDAWPKGTSPVSREGLHMPAEGNLKPEACPDILTSSEEEVGFIPYENGDWLQQEHDRVVDPATSGTESSDDSGAEMYSSRGESVSPEFMNSKIDWDSKVPDVVADRDLNSNLILRGVLEDDPILENVEIFSEESVASSAVISAAEDVGTESSNLEAQPEKTLIEEHVASDTKAVSSVESVVTTGPKELNRESSSASTNLSSPVKDKAGEISGARAKPSSLKNEAKPMEDAKAAKYSTNNVPSRNSSTAAPPKSSARRTLFPGIPTSPKPNRESVRRPGIRDLKGSNKPAAKVKTDKTSSDSTPLAKIDKNVLGLNPLSSSLSEVQVEKPFRPCSPPVYKTESFSDLIYATVKRTKSETLRRTLSDSVLFSNENVSRADLKRQKAEFAIPDISELNNSNVNKVNPDANPRPVSVESGSKLSTQSFTGASSQSTPLRKKTVSPPGGGTASIVKPVASPTRVSRSTLTQRRPVSTPPSPTKTAVLKGKHTPTGSTSSVNGNSSSSRQTTVTPIKPTWSNKKVSPTPVTPPERFSPFSVEDYNFQQWANEWASRQEKKKAEVNQSSRAAV